MALLRSSCGHRLAAALSLMLVASGCTSSGEGFSLDAAVKALVPQPAGTVMQDAVLSENPDVRRKALHTMSRWKNADDSMVALVGITLLGETDTMTRVQAARTLGAWGNPLGLGYLAIALTGKSFEATESTGPQGELVLPTIPDRSPFVRGAAAEALGTIRGDEAIEPLAAGLHTDTDPDVRIRCARSLRHHRHVAAARALLLGLADDDLVVRVTSRDSLGYMTGQDLGDDAKAWDTYLAGSETPLADYGNAPRRKRSTRSAWLHLSKDRQAKIREIFSDLFPLERKDGPFD